MRKAYVPDMIVKVEARRIARLRIKKAMKRDGLKISNFDAAEITKAAQELIERDRSILATARYNILRRNRSTRQAQR